MRVCIFGAGAIGGMVGFLLIKKGYDVTLIARREHYKAIKKNGLTFISNEYNIEETRKLKVFDNLESLGSFDLVINSLKAHSANQTAELVNNILHENTVVTLNLNGIPWWFFYKFEGELKNYQLNSVDPEKKQWNHITPNKVLGCVVYPAAIITQPGVIKHIEGKRFILGEPDGSKSERANIISNMFIKSGLKAPVSKNIRSDIWLKLIGNSSFNPLSVITQNTLKEMCENKDTKDIIKSMMNEAILIGKKLNINIKLTIEKELKEQKMLEIIKPQHFKTLKTKDLLSLMH